MAEENLKFTMLLGIGSRTQTVRVSRADFPLQSPQIYVTGLEKKKKW